MDFAGFGVTAKMIREITDFLDYLEVLASEPCGKSVPRNRLTTMALFEYLGELGLDTDGDLLLLMDFASRLAYGQLEIHGLVMWHQEELVTDAGVQNCKEICRVAQDVALRRATIHVWHQHGGSR